MKTISKKLLAVLLAMLMMASCAAVSASAVADFSLYELNSTNCKLDADSKSITVKSAAITLESDSYPIDFTITPAAGTAKAKQEDGSTLFYNLEAGKTYAIGGTITVGSETVQAAKSYSITLKKLQKEPAEPIPTLAATKITVNKLAGAEYRLLLVDGTVVKDWSETTEFTGLQPATRYQISVRYKETAAYYASNATTITVTTLAAGAAKPAAPVLKDKTNTMIAVVAEPGMEYSIDKNHKVWTVTGEFTGLTANTPYNVVARKVFDPGKEEPSAISDPTLITTNAKTRYEANIANAAMKIETKGDIYANRDFTFTVTGVTNADQGALQYGDTRYVPTTFSNAHTGETRAIAVSGVTGKATTHSTKEGDLILTVAFAQQRYINGHWEDTGVVENKVFTVTSKGEYNAFRVGLTSVLNFLFDTLPAALVKIFGSDASKGFFNTMIKVITALLGAASK